MRLMRNCARSNRCSKGADFKALDIFQLLPGTNCKKCEGLTCLAFAVKLVGKEIGIMKCPPLFTGEYEEKRDVLLDLIQSAGYEVPNTGKEPKLS